MTFVFFNTNVYPKMLISEFYDLESVEIEHSYGIAEVYQYDNMYLVCYPDIVGDDELPENATIYAVFNNSGDQNSDEETVYLEEMDEDNLFIIEEMKLMRLSKYSTDDDIELSRMANYHLHQCGIAAPNDMVACRRFDLESRLMDYGAETYQQFKAKTQQAAVDKLEIMVHSKNKASMENYISQLFFEMVCTRVVISGKNVWSYEEDGRWRKSDSDSSLWELLSNYFIRTLEAEPIIDEAAIYLGSYSVRKKILNDCKIKLSYPNFESKIDSNRNIIGVNNGTLVIKEGIVRKSTISDLISKSTHVDYIDYGMESRQVTTLLKVLRRVFPQEDLLRFFIRSCSTFLEGYNSKKVFYVWWGSGNNCKTGMASLVHSALGDYCGTAPVSLITSKRSGSSEATPDLCHIEGKLVVFLQEPNPKEKIKTGRIKELTGNDRVFVRNLFESGREMDVKCKLVHVCNFPTAGPDTDVAFRRRMIVIKFPSTFLDEDEYNHQKELGTLGKYTFKIEDGIEETFRSMGSVFLSILVNEYKAFLETGLHLPPIVKKNTEEFLTHSNYALKFIRKQLVKTNVNSDTEILLHDVYEMFKTWFKNMYPSYNIPNSETFAEELRDEGFIEEDGIIKNVSIPDCNVTVNLDYS